MLNNAGEEVPKNEVYQAKRNFLRAQGSNVRHKFLQYLRKNGVQHVVEKLKVLGFSPVACDASEMPHNKKWNNFAEVLYTFWILYCEYEGHSRTSKWARKLLLYLFYGYYDNHKGRMWPVVRQVHRMCTTGRHRFAKFTEKCFVTLFQLLNREPELVQFLTDKGEGSPPLRYLMAVEEGLRNHGKDIYSMGSHAMRSALDWSLVICWKKREAYIAAGRKKLGRFCYEQWDHYKLQDYQERHALAATFYNRHLALSNGDPIGTLPDPPEWSNPVPAKKSTKSKKRKRTAKRIVSVEAKKSKTEEDTEVLMFDPSSGQMVQILSSSDEE